VSEVNQVVVKLSCMLECELNALCFYKLVEH